MTHLSRFLKTTMALGLVLGSSALAQAEQTSSQQSQGKAPLIYPAKGQTQAQQEKDTLACQNWATQQTGFNPSTALAESQAQRTPSSVGEPRGNIGRGAAAGAAIGAISGDAGKGAAAGAAAGGVKRRSEMRHQAESEAQQQQQQTAALDQSLSEYNRAITACLEGRGYTVK